MNYSKLPWTSVKCVYDINISLSRQRKISVTIQIITVKGL